MSNEAQSLANEIEKDTDPHDKGSAVDSKSMADAQAAAQKAAADGITNKVAKLLEKDGYGDAADMVRNYASNNHVLGTSDGTGDDADGDQSIKALLQALQSAGNGHGKHKNDDPLSGDATG